MRSTADDGPAPLLCAEAACRLRPAVSAGTRSPPTDVPATGKATALVVHRMALELLALAREVGLVTLQRRLDRVVDEAERLLVADALDGER